MPETFLAQFSASVKSLQWPARKVFVAASPLVASAYGRSCVGLQPTPKILAASEENLWYKGYNWSRLSTNALPWFFLVWMWSFPLFVFHLIHAPQCVSLHNEVSRTCSAPDQSHNEVSYKCLSINCFVSFSFQRRLTDLYLVLIILSQINSHLICPSSEISEGWRKRNAFSTNAEPANKGKTLDSIIQISLFLSLLPVSWKVSTISPAHESDILHGTLDLWVRGLLLWVRNWHLAVHSKWIMINIFLRGFLE